MAWASRPDGGDVWDGPRSVPIFVRENRFFAVANLVVFVSIAVIGWVSWETIPLVVAVPLGVLTGGGFWGAALLGFSRGWIAESDV